MIDDPHLWLEEIESAPVLDGVEAQNAETLQRFRDEGVVADHKILKAIDAATQQVAASHCGQLADEF